MHRWSLVQECRDKNWLWPLITYKIGGSTHQETEGSVHLIYTEVHNLYFDCTILGHRLSWSFISGFLSPSQAAGEGRAPPGQVQGCPSQKIMISFLKKKVVKILIVTPTLTRASTSLSPWFDFNNTLLLTDRLATWEWYFTCDIEYLSYATHWIFVTCEF